MVFGTNALITKPAVSLAPLVTVALLEMHGFTEMKEGNITPSTGLVELVMAMFNIVCFTPVVIGLVQLFVWVFYRIRDSHKSIPLFRET